MSAEEVAALGPGLASLMSIEQLTEAFLLLNSISASTTQQNSNSMEAVRLVFMNHLHRCIRMPAGGATSGGSQQTGFEIELITSDAASRIFEGWPNREASSGGRRMSWELRSMDDLADKLALQTAGWGGLQGKPMPIAAGRTTHTGVILIAPPFTVSFTTRPDRTTSLSVRFPLVLWSEEDNVILPPDDSDGTPFFADPAAQPGFHRDLFKTWGRRIAAELLMMDYPMSPLVRSHLPTAYQSESDEDEVVTSRSCSPVRGDTEKIDILVWALVVALA